MPVQSDFFEIYIANLFVEVGLDALAEDQKAVYIPQFTAELRQRVSNELVPRLSKEQVEQFVSLIDNPEVTGESWRDFWYTAIPNFEIEIGKILVAFKEELKASMDI